jgi:hypothetical protein
MKMVALRSSETSVRIYQHRVAFLKIVNFKTNITYTINIQKKIKNYKMTSPII